MILSLVLVLVVLFPVTAITGAFIVIRASYKRNHPPELTYADHKALYEKTGDMDEYELMLNSIKED